jgi:hypothetical protein
MSKLRENIERVLINNNGLYSATIGCEQITEDFAIKFAEWLSGIKYGQLEYFNGSNLKPYKELLQIFKDNYYE